MIPEPWYDRATCWKEKVDPKVFEGDKTVDARYRWRKAKSYCDRCPVAADCLAEAMNHKGLPHWQRWQSFSMFQAGFTPKQLSKMYHQTERQAA